MSPFDWTVLREAPVDLQILKVTSPPLQGSNPSPSSAAESASTRPASCLLFPGEFHGPRRSSLPSLPRWPFSPRSLLAFVPRRLSHSCFSFLPSRSFSLPQVSLSGAEFCASLRACKSSSPSLLELLPGRVDWLCSALASNSASPSSALASTFWQCLYYSCCSSFLHWISSSPSSEPSPPSLQSSSCSF